ncbi:hypothetical protein MMC24_006151 [Lignoscripta atroalba]|nr:hypothetical protein [Lignoscripta atroalba]
MDAIKGKNAIGAVASDLCSKYMHDNNSLGLWVLNRRGDWGKAYGDKELFEPHNENSKKLMECLQAAVDGIYKACETCSVPDIPDGYIAWQKAPDRGRLKQAQPARCSMPPAITGVNSRIRTANHRTRTQNSWYKWPPWEGYRILAKNLFQSDYCKKL